MLLLTKILEEFLWAMKGRPLKEAEKDIFGTFVDCFPVGEVSLVHRYKIEITSLLSMVNPQKFCKK